MNRRSFLGNSTKFLGALGLLSMAPNMLFADDKSRNILILFAHTYWENSKINKTLLNEAAKIKGVKIHNLTETYPDSKIDAQKEVELLKWADKIIMQFPLFWYSTPSLLKEWEDEVLVKIDAMDMQTKSKTLSGKTFQIITTAGGKAQSYDGRHGATIKQLLLPIYHTFGYLNATPKDPYAIYDVGNIPLDKLPIKEYLRQIQL